MPYKSAKPSRNPVQEVVADTSARKGQGPKVHKQEARINVKNPSLIERAFPLDRGWGSIRILTGATKPSLASLFRPQSASDNVHQQQGNQDNANVSTMIKAIAATAKGLPGISTGPGGRGDKLFLVATLATVSASNCIHGRRCSSSASAVSAIQCDKEIPAPTTSPSIPASGLLEISSSPRVRQVGLTLPPILPTLPPPNSIQSLAGSSPGDAAASKKADVPNSRVKGEKACHSVNA